MSHINVSEAARRLGAKPKDISDLFYLRKLNDDRAPVVSGRRAIEVAYLPEIATALKANGRVVGIAA